jgi:hypothetical protein
MTPRILFLMPAGEDYLVDSLFHGLRSLLGSAVIDYPKRDIAYMTYPDVRGLYGRGFTLYGLLEDVPLDRSFDLDAEAAAEFDLVVFPDAWSHWPLLDELLRGESTGPLIAVLDGSDGDVAFPYRLRVGRARCRRRLARGHPRLTCFKRELRPGALVCYRPRPLGGRLRLPALSVRAPPALQDRVPFTGSLLPIAFSIPEEKIGTIQPAKDKLFARHVVDPEVARRLGSPRSYVFNAEQEYYRDLRLSRFAITTRRAGWDCLRHYEIAANGCVPCFRDLDQKPATSAPHGLRPGENCLLYRSYEELIEQVEAISAETYMGLQLGALLWARQNSTGRRALRFLEAAGVITHRSATVGRGRPRRSG